MNSNFDDNFARENRKTRIRKALLSAAKRQFLEQQQQKQLRQHGESSKMQNKMNEGNLHIKIENISIFQEQSKSSTKIQISPVTLAAPISPSPMELIDTVLPKLNLSLETHRTSSSTLPTSQKRKLLIDFGVGDGRWVIAASKAYGCRSIGYDVDLERLTLAQQTITKLSINSDDSNFTKNNDECDKSFPSKIQDLIQLERRDTFQAIEDETNNSITQANVFVFYLFREALFQISILLKQRGFLPTLPTIMTRNDTIHKMSKHNSCINIDYNTGIHIGNNDDDRKKMIDEPNTSEVKELFKETQIISVGFALPCWSSPVWSEKCCGIPVYLYNAYLRL